MRREGGTLHGRMTMGYALLILSVALWGSTVFLVRNVSLGLIGIIFSAFCQAMGTILLVWGHTHRGIPAVYQKYPDL